MERYLGEYGSNYSHRLYQILLVGYGLFFLTILSLLAQAYEEISAGRNLSGEYAPLGLQDYLGLLFVIAMGAGLKSQNAGHSPPGCGNHRKSIHNQGSS